MVFWSGWGSSLGSDGHVIVIAAADGCRGPTSAAAAVAVVPGGPEVTSAAAGALPATGRRRCPALGAPGAACSSKGAVLGTRDDDGPRLEAEPFETAKTGPRPCSWDSP